MAGGQGIDQEGVGLVVGAVNDRIEQPNGGERRTERKVRAVPFEQGHGISTIAEQARLENQVHPRHVGVGQQEESRRVRRHAVEVECGVDVGGYGVSAPFVEHHDVAVEGRIGFAVKLHEFEAVGNRIGVAIDLIHEKPLGEGGPGKTEGEDQKQDDCWEGGGYGTHFQSVGIGGRK